MIYQLSHKYNRANNVVIQNAMIVNTLTYTRANNVVIQNDMIVNTLT